MLTKVLKKNKILFLKQEIQKIKRGNVFVIKFCQAQNLYTEHNITRLFLTTCYR